MKDRCVYESLKLRKRTANREADLGHMSSWTNTNDEAIWSQTLVWKRLTKAGLLLPYNCRRHFEIVSDY